VEFETRALHAGQDPEPITGSVNVPIFQTTTYAQDGVGELRSGHDYARTVNPSRTALETCLASLEAADHGACFSSGMAASTAVMELFRPGQRIVSMNDVYGGTYRLFSKLYEPKGYRFAYVDLTDLDLVRQALEGGADLVWIETPTNPLLKVVDIAAVSAAAHDAGAQVVVDNTFASPYLQNPLTLGADIVVHSTTKYIGGHSDVVGGFAGTNDGAVAERLHFVQNSMGAKTLALRMQRHCENAARIAARLAASSVVDEVIYPGLESHPQHELAARQMRGFGGMVSFRVKGGRAAADAALADTGLWTLAESLGGAESLVEHPGVMTHASLAGSGFEVPDDLIRLSVGIEHVDDLERDLDGMLERAATEAAVRS
jgi:cystathionine gamma-synthase